MDRQKTHDEDVKKLGELLEDMRIGMLTTAETDGSLHSRPMATQQIEFDGDLWFFTEIDSGKVHELQQDRNVNVSYASEKDNRYVSITGKGNLVRDRAKIEELWNPILKAWFPKGLEDPNLGLLKITVTSAEYWDSPSSVVVHLVGFIKATVTGQSYEPGEHAKVDLKK